MHIISCPTGRNRKVFKVELLNEPVTWGQLLTVLGIASWILGGYLSNKLLASATIDGRDGISFLAYQNQTADGAIRAAAYFYGLYGLWQVKQLVKSSAAAG